MLINKRVKLLRENKGWSQVELAKRIGLTPAGMNKLENKENSNPKLKTIISLAKVFKISLDELVGLKKLSFKKRLLAKVKK